MMLRASIMSITSKPGIQLSSSSPLPDEPPPPSLLTVTVIDVACECPSPSYARALIVCSPFPTAVVSHSYDQGPVPTASIQPSSSMETSASDTSPSTSPAVPEIVTIPDTVVPLTGDDIVRKGGAFPAIAANRTTTASM